ncbi:hypothetical protein AU210_016072 [Fusarium oxysporum f. sp. radicis-cucumerinum]|uniref:Uncharacterized protein n=1 Tax=Fusarium oxysporum f. sp. radicis-cucumerinum TaxID=327505 RepID=A0A2H3GDM1_FUSOX|nr:hypothetical protein AU210_016072 [Fusarium oxysporum f. sp. radicis-cucumerinum]
MPSDPNLKAARAVVLSRQRLQKGLSRDASNGLKKPLTLRDAECQYPGSKKSSIARIVKRLEEANTLDFEQVPEPNKGRPRLLSDDEEEAIVSFIIWMQKSGLPASKHEIEDAANTIRSRRDPDAVPEIFDEGFTAAHIIAGFEKSGIFPPTDKPAVNYLLRKKLKTCKAIDPALSSLLPEESRFPLASDTARDIGNRYHDILSSPTLRGLESVRKIVNEAIVLEEIVRNHVEDRRARIEKRYHQRKRGKRARPVGDYIHNGSLQELRDQHTEFVKAGDKAQQRSQLRNLRSFAIRQMEEIKTE